MGELFKASLFPYEELQKRVLEGGNGEDNNATPHPVTSVNDLTGDVVLTPAIIGAEPLGAAKSAVTQHNANNEAHPDIRNLIANVPGQTDSKITEHNSSGASHSDIRDLIADIKAVVDEFFAEGADNDQNLDRLVEIVTLINSNKNVIDTLATNKVNISDIVNNLTSNSTNKPLSAAQGAALKALIDALDSNKLAASALTSAINTALAQAKASGEFNGAPGANGTSVTVSTVSESTASGGSNVVTFSDGKKVTIKNGKDYVLTEADKKEIAGLVDETATIPDYWYESFTDKSGKVFANYLKEKIAHIKSLQDQCGKNGFSFIIITDMHYEQNLGKISPKLAKKIADECGIKYVLILGDSGTRNGILHDLAYIDTEWDNIENMITPIRDRLLITDGNHDGSYGATDGDGDGVIDDVHGSGNSAFNFTPQKKYNRIKRKVSLIDGVTFDESGCGYYADDKTAKIRYIVLSTHNNKYEENEDGSSKYSNMMNFRYGQSQFDLVIDALNTLEEGWSVLVASHVPLDRSGELLPWGATEVEDNRLVSGEVECWLMADVLNAFVNKGTHKGSFMGTQGATASYHNLVNKTEDLDGDGKADWLTGYRTSSSGVSQEAGYDVTNFLGDGKTPVGNKTIYFKNCKISNQRLFFYDADKKPVYNCYPTTFSGYTGFDGVATEGSLYIDPEKNASLYTTAVYVRLCTVSGDDNPIITLDEPIVANGAAFDAVSVDVDFTNAKGTLIGYFGGHVHKDGEWGTTYTWNDRLKQCDFWTIATRCDSRNENDSSIDEKIKGTITEQSFDVFTINTSNHTIYATKIGAGINREIKY